MDMDPIQAYDACVAATKDYVERAGFSDVVVGLSGGLDSSVVATMAVDAFGKDHVHGFMLPGPFSTAASVSDARALAHNLHLEVKTLSITLPYENLRAIYKRGTGAEMGDVASQNTQARLRMAYLMALSNDHGWLLMNTGNKSEAAMGYSTLYGDTAGAFAPIGGLYKTDVYAVARARNERAAKAGETVPVPGTVLVKAPSAELAEGQLDEEALGMGYEELDRILVGHYERGKAPAELADDAEGQARAADVVRRADSFAYKRAQEPPCPDAPFYGTAESE